MLLEKEIKLIRVKHPFRFVGVKVRITHVHITFAYFAYVMLLHITYFGNGRPSYIYNIDFVNQEEQKDILDIHVTTNIVTKIFFKFHSYQ